MMTLQKGTGKARLSQEPEADELDLSVPDICHQRVHLYEGALRQRVSGAKADRLQPVMEITDYRNGRQSRVPKIMTIFCRHCVVMELVNGHTLQAVTEVPDPATLYDKLIKLLIKFANHGVIHGDFNEFNIMLDTQTADPIIIDFPQVSLFVLFQKQ